MNKTALAFTQLSSEDEMSTKVNKKCKWNSMENAEEEAFGFFVCFNFY